MRGIASSYGKVLSTMACSSVRDFKSSRYYYHVGCQPCCAAVSPLLLHFGARLFPIAWASGRPIKLSARCATVESEIIAEVPFAASTMQAVQDS